MVRFGFPVTASIVESFGATELVRFLYFAVGIGCLLVAIVDLFWTTLWDDKRAGPLSSR